MIAEAHSELSREIKMRQIGRVLTGAIIVATLFYSRSDAAMKCVDFTSANGCYITINAAIAAAATEDTILVMPGVYTECVNINKKVVLLGASHEDTFILCPLGNAVTFAGGSSGASICRFTIEAQVGHGVFCNTYHLVFDVTNCVIHDCGGDGIHTDNSTGPISIRNCVIRTNSAQGIYIYSSPGMYQLLCGNIVDSNTSYGLNIMNPGGVMREYNCYYGNKGGNPGSLGTGEIILLPKFVDPIHGDYHLQSDSPCLDSGKPGLGSLDCDGTRNDMGVYGGPYAHCGPGPVVTQLQLVPATVVKGETFKIQAKGVTR
jgi:parallel beta-helix repeat protein